MSLIGEHWINICAAVNSISGHALVCASLNSTSSTSSPLSTVVDLQISMPGLVQTASSNRGRIPVCIVPTCLLPLNNMSVRSGPERNNSSEAILRKIVFFFKSPSGLAQETLCYVTWRIDAKIYTYMCYSGTVAPRLRHSSQRPPRPPSHNSAFTILNKASRPGLIICVILIADPPTGVQLITSGTPPVLQSVALVSIDIMK